MKWLIAVASEFGLWKKPSTGVVLERRALAKEYHASGKKLRDTWQTSGDGANTFNFYACAYRILEASLSNTLRIYL